MKYYIICTLISQFLIVFFVIWSYYCRGSQAPHTC